MSEDGTREQLRRSVQSIAEDLDRLVSIAQGDEIALDDVRLLESYGAAIALSVLTDDPDAFVAIDTDEYVEMADTAIRESVLEAYATGRRGLASGEWDVTGVVVVFTIGGPHIELETATGAVHGYWGGDVARYSVSSDTVAFFEAWGE